MSVGDQSRSQLAGRGRSVFQLLCNRRHVTPVGAPPQLMFPDGLLKWNVRAARADGRAGACAATSAARLNARTTTADRENIENPRLQRRRDGLFAHDEDDVPGLLMRVDVPVRVSDILESVRAVDYRSIVAGL